MGYMQGADRYQVILLPDTLDGYVGVENGVRAINADFRKDNAKSIKEASKAFVKLCNRAGLLSHEPVVIDGSKSRAINAGNKSYVSSNAKKVLLDVEGKTGRYMKELDEKDAAESKPGAWTKEDIAGVLDYLEGRKTQLAEALEQMADSGENNASK